MKLLVLLFTFIALNSYAQEFNQSLCPITNANNYEQETSFITGPIQPLMQWPAFAKQFKSWEQLEVYFYCYRNRVKKNYTLDDKQKEIIEEAASHYKIPVAFIACTLYLESKFNPNAKPLDPKATDLGLAQFTDSTMVTMKNLIRGPKESNVKWCEQELPKKSISAERRKYCEQVMEINGHNYQEDSWGPLLEELEDKGLMYDYKFSRVDPYEPIVLAAFYLRHIINTAILPYLPDRKLSFDEQLKVYQMAIAGYNMGRPRLKKVLAAAKTDNINKLFKKSRIIDSTIVYMDGMAKCMTHNNFKAIKYNKNYERKCEEETVPEMLSN